MKSAAHHRATSLHFELDGVEGSLQDMDLLVVGGDDEVAVDPGGIFVSADQKIQGELFEHVVVEDLEVVTGKRAENGARFGDVLDEDGQELKIAIRNDSGYSNEVIGLAAEHMAATFRAAGVNAVGIPGKLNAYSEGNPNGIPG